MMRKTVPCPYCYEQIGLRQIEFRCTGRLSRTNKQCTLREDKVLATQTGVRRQLGPVFQLDGRKGTATCPACDSETNYRVCPFCHSQLPVQFGMVSSDIIAMAGPKDAGKTVYMTVLLHELRNRIGDQFGASIMGADDETRKLFVRGYEQPLYNDSRLPQPTQRAAQQHNNRIAPLVFRFAATTPGESRDRRTAHTLLSFFDAAGEDFQEQESREVNTRYLGCASGILLILDPLQMAGPQRGSSSGPAQESGPEYDTPLNILSRITDILLPPSGRRTHAKISKPIAVVFTKLDAIWHSLDRASRLHAQPPGIPAFDVADSCDVHQEIRELLREWDGGRQIGQTLDNHYERYRLFAVSALGQPPTESKSVAPSGIQPHRVADPLLWLLSEFGAVPKVGKG